MSEIYNSFATGYACLSAWADLLDHINVFPVADADTGTNLRISLAPLRNPATCRSPIEKRLAFCATGNSGNIAAAFFQEFCQVGQFSDLAEKAVSGRIKAWQAIANPCTGTMLTVFDSLASVLSSQKEVGSFYASMSSALQEAVLETSQILPDLKKAGVVDAGALAMYIFFDGFFNYLTRQPSPPISIFEHFAGKLAISKSYRPEATEDHCVDAVIQLEEGHDTLKDNLARLGESVVVVGDDTNLKVHIHTPEPGKLHHQLHSYGKVIQWSDEKITQGRVDNDSEKVQQSPLHIITDAAGSLPKKLARDHGITLLDSYIISGDNSSPESLCHADQIYARMLTGKKITTAQASTFERHQYYKSILEQHGPSLYLCVGAAFTGNYDTAAAWKIENDPTDQFTVIDSGAASGRLALIVLLTAKYSYTSSAPEEVIAFARSTISECEEYVFIDELKYLAAGGRLAKSSSFFGDLLHMKPVISPTSEGAKKVGVVHSRKGQLAFALQKLRTKFTSSSLVLIMLQYSNNEQWVSDTVRQRVKELLPHAEILITPLSLTSGVHMGPGTWSMAFSSTILPSSSD